MGERETFWDTWERAQRSTTEQERLEEAQEMAAWDRASTADLLAAEEHERTER